MLQKYPGAKTNSGIIQWLINRIPLHEQYLELYAGSARLYAAKRPAGGNVLNDLNVNTAVKLQKMYQWEAAVYNLPALQLIKDYGNNPDAFMYLDPPYPFSSRRSGAKIYKHEMTDDNHLELLQTIKSIQALVMISTRQNCLYDHELADWRKEEFKTMGHHGPAVEIIYMNYPPPLLLHQYDHIGNGYVDRQRVKRKITRFASKLQELPLYERHLFIQELIKNDPAAVQHFLSVGSGGHSR